MGLYSDTTSTEVSDSIKTSSIRIRKELLLEPQSLSERNLSLEGNQQNMVVISSKDLDGDFQIVMLIWNYPHLLWRII